MLNIFLEGKLCWTPLSLSATPTPSSFETFPIISEILAVAADAGHVVSIIRRDIPGDAQLPSNWRQLAIKHAGIIAVFI